MPPKGSKRGPDGKWYVPGSGAPPSPPAAATPRPKATAAEGEALGVTPERTPAKRPRTSSGVGGRPPREEAALVDVKRVRKELNVYVKGLAKLVDDDWHDSYEETDEMLREWLEDCAKQAEHVLQVGILGGAALDRCHEVLKIIVDTWSNIRAIPFRGDPGESLSMGEAVEFHAALEASDDSEALEVTSATTLVEYAWPLLLARAAAVAGTPDALLLQMIKDAHDHGVPKVHEPSEHEEVPTDLAETVRRGRARLAQLAARKAEWSALPTTVKVHRMRRAIDRRFDGPLHRRTRDPAMFGDDPGDAGCSVM